MTTTLTGTTNVGTTPTWRRWYLPALFAILLVGLSIRLWGYTGAYALNVDEIIYGSLASSVPTHGLIPVTFLGLPFLLHPPMAFLLAAFTTPSSGLPTIPVDLGPALVDGARVTNIIVGALTILIVAELVRRTAPLARPNLAAGLGLATATVFALDPFVLRQNGMFFLETITLAFVMVGYLVLVGAVRTGELTTKRLLGAGLLLGLGILTKDFALLLVAVPLVAAAIWRLGGIPARRWLALLGTSLVPYLAYVLYVATTPHLQELINSKTHGLGRAVGGGATTGFTAPGAPNLFSVLLGQVATYWPTYLLIVLSVPAVIFLLVRGNAVARLVGLVGASGALLLGTGAVRGTLEEHFLYFLFLPALVSVAVTVAYLASPVTFNRHGVIRPNRLAAPVAFAVAGVMALAGVVSAVPLRTTPDDGYLQAVSWVLDHSDQDTVVAWASGRNNATNIDRFMFSQLPSGAWALPGDAWVHDVTYVVTLQRQIDQGYTYTGSNFLDDVIPTYATPVYSVQTRWAGLVQVWKVDQKKLAHADLTLVNPAAATQ